MYINVGIFGLLSAVEYSVILPTIWLYINSTYGSESWYFGLCISGFHMSSLLFSPIFGFLNDWGINTKSLVMFANLFQVGQNYDKIRNCFFSPAFEIISDSLSASKKTSDFNRFGKKFEWQYKCRGQIVKRKLILPLVLHPLRFLAVFYILFALNGWSLQRDLWQA